MHSEGKEKAAPVVTDAAFGFRERGYKRNYLETVFSEVVLLTAVLVSEDQVLTEDISTAGMFWVIRAVNLFGVKGYPLPLVVVLPVMKAASFDQVFTEEVSCGIICGITCRVAASVWGTLLFPPVMLVCCCWVKANCWKVLKLFMAGEILVNKKSGACFSTSAAENKKICCCSKGSIR